MSSKLTLTIEQNVIKLAKSYAHKKGRSLSEIIENYLKSLTSNTENQDQDLSPEVKKILGIIQLPQDFDYKKDLAEELHRKHSK